MKKCVFCQIKAEWQCLCSQDYMCQQHLPEHLIKVEKHIMIPVLTAERIAKAKTEIFQRIKVIKSVKKNIKLSTDMFIEKTQWLSKQTLVGLNQLKASYEELLEVGDFNETQNLNIERILTTKLTLKYDKALEVGQDVMNYYTQMFVCEEKCYEGTQIDSGLNQSEALEIPPIVHNSPYKIEAMQTPLMHSIESNDLIQLSRTSGNDLVLLIEDESVISDDHCRKNTKKHSMSYYQINCSSDEPLVLINIYKELVTKLNTDNNFINFGNIFLDDPKSARVFLRFNNEFMDKKLSWSTKHIKFLTKKIKKFPVIDKELLNKDNFLQWCGEFRNSDAVIFCESTDALEMEIMEADNEINKISEKRLVKHCEDHASRKKRNIKEI